MRYNDWVTNAKAYYLHPHVPANDADNDDTATNPEPRHCVGSRLEATSGGLGTPESVLSFAQGMPAELSCLSPVPIVDPGMPAPSSLSFHSCWHTFATSQLT